MMKFLLALTLTGGFAFSAQVPRQAAEFAISMPDGSEKLLSSYRGKVVVLAFVSTMCSHCQHMMGTLSVVQKDYAGKGVQVLASAFNENSKDLIASFDQTYVKGFPAGWNKPGSVFEFLQHDPKVQYFVPILVFIDRKGVIHRQIVDDPTFLQDPEKNVRATIDGLLKEPAAKTPVHKRTVTTSSTK